MKLIFHDLTTPLLDFKCGPAIPAAAIEGGLGLIGGLGSSVMQGEYSAANVDKQLEAQKRENQLNRDWQTFEAERNRSFQSSQVLQQNNLARELMATQNFNQQQLAAQQQGYNLQSMAKQAEYNSPVYQAQELRKANINPQVYFGSQSSFSGSSALSGGAPSAGSGSVPGAPSGSMPGSVGGLSPVGYQPPNLQIGQILKDFADARKSMAQTKTEDLMRDPMYKEVMSKVKNQELVNQYQELANFVFNETKNLKVQRAFIELSKAEKDCILADDQHTLNVAEKRYKESLVSLNRAAESLQGTQAMLFGLKVENFDKDFQSELAVRRSEVVRNKAQAYESNASARFANSQAFERELSNEISKATQPYDIDNAIYNADVLQFMQQSSSKEELFQQLARQIKLSKAYRDTNNKVRLDATIENVRKILGINVGASVHN